MGVTEQLSLVIGKLEHDHCMPCGKTSHLDSAAKISEAGQGDR